MTIDNIRDGSRTAATSKMEHFVIIVNGWKPLIIITRRSILDDAAVLDPLLNVADTSTNLSWRHDIGSSVVVFLVLNYIY